MYVPPENIVLFFLISFLIYTMPDILVKFSNSLKGKLLLLILTIMVTMHNLVAGIIMVMFYIFLSEFNYEFNNEVIYEGFENDDELLVKRNSKDKLNIESELRPRDSSIITPFM
jgi:hypothetical protein